MDPAAQLEQDRFAGLRCGGFGCGTVDSADVGKGVAEPLFGGGVGHQYLAQVVRFGDTGDDRGTDVGAVELADDAFGGQARSCVEGESCPDGLPVELSRDARAMRRRLRRGTP